MSNGIGTSDDFAHLSPEKYIIIFNQFNLLLSQPTPSTPALDDGALDTHLFGCIRYD
jgi:hypothetical protein